MSVKEAIKKAAAGLDHKRDDDWQEDGRPSLKRVQQIAKTTAITQDQLDDAVPDLRRNQGHGNGSTSTPDAAKPDVAGTSKAPAKAVTRTDEVAERIRIASGVGDKPAADKPAKKQPFLENVLMVATEPGYYGSKVRDPGETFYYTGRKGKWMDYADAADRKRYAQEREDSAAGLDVGQNDAQLGSAA